MKVADRWDGAALPFLGDRTLRLLAIPAGARILSARLRLEPVSADPRAPFVERLTFGDDALPGAAAARVATAGALEIDLRGRRTLHAVEGTGLNGAQLYVDPGGGIFVAVAPDGTLGSSTAVFPLAQTGGAPAAVPGIAATRVRLRAGGISADSVTAVQVRSVPAGLTLRVGDLPTFWAHPAELAEPVFTPDFATILAAWVDGAADAAEHGYVAVPITLHTEALARFRLYAEVELLRTAPLVLGGLAGGPPGATLPFGISSLALPPAGAASGDFVARLPRGACAVPGETRATVRGAFDETRAVPGRGPTGRIDPDAARGKALVSPTFTQAAEIPPGSGTVLAGIDLLVRPLTRQATLQVDLRADADGKPVRGSSLREPVRVDVRQGADPERPEWVTVPLQAPFTVDACRRYWLVLQAVDGEADWVAYGAGTEAARRLTLAGDAPCPVPGPVPPPVQNSDDGGASWLSGGALIPIYRLRTLPARWEVPLEVEVGRGLDASRISLARHAPLGRVDFTVDDPALAAAVTAHARGTADGCAPGERLADGAFAEWTVDGDAVGGAAAIDVHDALALRAAAAPDGRFAFALAARSATPLLLRLDVPSDAVLNEIELDPAVPLPVVSDTAGARGIPDACALLVHPDGTRAYVLTPGAGAEPPLRVQVIDLERGRAAGPARSIPPGDGVPLPARGDAPFPRIAAAVSPDGATLWVAGGAVLAELDTDALEHADAGAPASELVRTRHDLPAQRATCIAAGLDGERLYVGAAAGESGEDGELLEIDASGAGRPPATVRLPAVPREVAVGTTADLAWAVAAHASGATLVDLDRLAAVPVGAKTAVAGVAAAADPAGRRAYVGARAALVVLDPARRLLVSQPLAGVPAGADVAALAATPQGDRVYAVAGGALLAVAIGERRLAAWTIEAGQVAVGPARGDLPHGVVLGDAEQAKPDPSSIAQTLAVSPGCRYVLSFDALAAGGSGAYAELLWLGAQREPLDPERIPLDESARFAELPRTLRPHRRVLRAPERAAFVEVRFRAPVRAAEVASASFAVSADLLVNGDLRLPLRGDDGGWEVRPEQRSAVARADAGGGARLRGVGPAPAEIAQEMEIEPGVPLALVFEGSAEPGPDGATPALEVRWMDGDGREIGSPARAAVGPDDFGRRALRLEPPSGATRAEVRMTVPARATLLARSLAIVPAPDEDVPVRFIASAPGELTVSGARVAYEPGPCADAAGVGVPAAAGPAGAAPATAAGSPAEAPGGTPAGDTPAPAPVGGETEECEACDEAAEAAVLAAVDVRPAAATAVRVRALPLTVVKPTVGVQWLRPGTVRLRPLPLPVTPPPPPVVTTTPTLAVKGIGAVREARLAKVGILTAERIATATPDELLRADATLAPRTAETLIAEAKRVVKAAQPA